MVTRPLNSAGQTLVEACVSALALAFFIKLLGIALYAGFAHLWLDHQSYEFAVCETQLPRIAGQCEGKFRRSVGSLLRVGELQSVRLYRRSNQIEVQVSFNVINDLVLERKKTLPLPLIR